VVVVDDVVDDEVVVGGAVVVVVERVAAVSVVTQRTSRAGGPSPRRGKHDGEQASTMPARELHVPTLPTNLECSRAAYRSAHR
jgi:hypothetical protein